MNSSEGRNAVSRSSNHSQTRRAGRRLLLAAGLLAVLLIPAARATPGALDPSFGSGGKVTTAVAPTDSGALALARQPDGKLVAAGYGSTGYNDDFALARYNADGSPDTSFGSGGKVVTAIGSSDDAVSAIVLQPDGKLVAAGAGSNNSGPDFALARYNPDGSLDTSFNGTGKVTTAIGPGTDYAEALALQPDGKLVAAGWSFNGSDRDFALARYNPNGSLDTSFGTGGKVTTFIGSGNDTAYALALQPDGKLVVAGNNVQGSQSVVALARFNPNGSLDSSFGSGGKVAAAIGAYASAGAVALQPDGKLVVAGVGDTGSQRTFALARFNPNGSLDSSFGSGGKVTTAIGSTLDIAEAIALQPDGKLVAAGSARTGSGDVFALARYETNGSLDTGFGSGGKLTTAVASDGEAYGLVLQPDGKPVAAGGSWDGSKEQFTLVRYLGSTLTVVKAGNGAGTVTSSAGEINCGLTCSAPVAAAPVTLTATASPGSTFAGWSGDCSGTGTCTVTMSAARSVTATFTALCVVPKVKGKKLPAAKRALRKSHCSVGKVTRVFSAKVPKGRVISPKPKAGKKLASGARIKLAVSKGKRK